MFGTFHTDKCEEKVNGALRIMPTSQYTSSSRRHQRPTLGRTSWMSDIAISFRILAKVPDNLTHVTPLNCCSVGSAVYIAFYLVWQCLFLHIDFNFDVGKLAKGNCTYTAYMVTRYHKLNIYTMCWALSCLTFIGWDYTNSFEPFSR